MKITHSRLMRAYYKSNYHLNFSPNEHALFQALMLKACQHSYPRRLFLVSTSEMAELSHISPSNIVRVRKRLFSRAEVDGVPIFTWRRRWKRGWGEVTVDYLTFFAQFPAGLLQEIAWEDSDDEQEYRSTDLS